MFGGCPGYFPRARRRTNGLHVQLHKDPVGQVCLHFPFHRWKAEAQMHEGSCSGRESLLRPLGQPNPLPFPAAIVFHLQ